MHDLCKKKIKRQQRKENVSETSSYKAPTCYKAHYLINKSANFHRSTQVGSQQLPNNGFNGAFNRLLQPQDSQQKLPQLLCFSSYPTLPEAGRRTHRTNKKEVRNFTLNFLHLIIVRIHLSSFLYYS